MASDRSGSHSEQRDTQPFDRGPSRTHGSNRGHLVIARCFSPYDTADCRCYRGVSSKSTIAPRIWADCALREVGKPRFRSKDFSPSKARSSILDNSRPPLHTPKQPTNRLGSPVAVPSPITRAVSPPQTALSKPLESACKPDAEFRFASQRNLVTFRIAEAHTR